MSASLNFPEADGGRSDGLVKRAAIAGAAGRVAAGGKPLIVHDVRSDPFYLPMTGEQVGSALILPLKVGTQIMGVLNMESDEVGGFDAQGRFPGHLGLQSMHERVEGAGGRLEVQSAPGRGTKVRAVAPFTDKQVGELRRTRAVAHPQ